ncbi:hypothetical protein [Nocardia sp. N2S4-5]|uniref:hypothetical protein n=1 Tax=Nocardia sp. N2S4-5 TaxID=3351565 RepID=UPI0037D3C950
MSAHDSTNEASIAAAQAAGWPELTGTPPQIGWANTIRAEKMRDYEAAAPSMSAADQVRFREVMLRQTKAGAWIDNRSHPWQTMLVLNFTPEELAELRAKVDSSSNPSDS